MSESNGSEGGGLDGAGASMTKEEIVALVNQAIGGRLRRSEEASNAKLDALTEMVGKLGKPDADPPPGDPPGEGEAGVDPQLAQLQRQLVAQGKQLSEEMDARKAAEASRAAAALKSAVMTQLGGHSITGERQGAAIAALYYSDKVKTAVDGAHLFVTPDGIDVPLSDGLKEWAGTDAAKLYLPPREASGSGASGNHAAPKVLKGVDAELAEAIAYAHANPPI